MRMTPAKEQRRQTTIGSDKNWLKIAEDWLKLAASLEAEEALDKKTEAQGRTKKPPPLST